MSTMQEISVEEIEQVIKSKTQLFWLLAYSSYKRKGLYLFDIVNAKICILSAFFCSSLIANPYQDKKISD